MTNRVRCKAAWKQQRFYLMILKLEKKNFYLPTPPMTELESNFAFFVAKSWLLLSAAGAMTAV